MLESYIYCEENTLGLSKKIFYYDHDGNLVMLKIRYNSEAGQRVENIYVNNGEVLFVDYIVTNYNNTEDGAESTIKSKLYFENQILFFWIKDGVTVNPDTTEFNSKIKYWQSEFDDLKISEFLKNPDCKPTENVVPSISKEQEMIIKECDSIDLTKEPDEKFGYVYEDPSKKGSWKPVHEITEDEKVADSFRRWLENDIQYIVLESSSPSGDWYRIDDYCFDTQEKILKIQSDLRTFQGDVQVVRTWAYNTEGDATDTNVQVFQLNTKEPIEPDKASFIDNPPYLTPNYKDLVGHLELEISDK
jgi:hypothetical protein